MEESKNGLEGGETSRNIGPILQGNINTLPLYIYKIMYHQKMLEKEPKKQVPNNLAQA